MYQHCKHYMKQIKALFPLIGNTEKKYLRNLKKTMDIYCRETACDSIEELTEEFGTPASNIKEYYSSMEFDYIAKQIQKSRTLKKLSRLLICFTVIISLFCLFEVKQFYDNCQFYIETEIDHYYEIIH